jgi:cytochrome c-type biogenesis protein CcmH
MPRASRLAGVPATAAVLAARAAPATGVMLAACVAIGPFAPTASLAMGAVATSATATTSTGAQHPAAPRASLPAIERRVMCVTCKIPLIVAESPQADRERVFIRGLIAEGRSEAQIERALVSQYGPAALGLPSAQGFDLSAYLVPLLVVLALAGMLALLLPRWRRRTRARPDQPAGPTLSATETARLDADLARFDR